MYLKLLIKINFTLQKNMVYAILFFEKSFYVLKMKFNFKKQNSKMIDIM